MCFRQNHDDDDNADDDDDDEAADADKDVTSSPVQKSDITSTITSLQVLSVHSRLPVTAL